MKKAAFFTFQINREGIENRLGEIERKMDRLRSLYDSYFMGMEKIPPDTLRREVNRMMLEMQQVPIGNASLRFRFQALTQKWVLHMTYWNRTMREIEAGTYRRDIARAQRHMAERGGVITEEEALAIGIPKSRVKAFVAHQQRQVAKKQGTEPAPADARAQPAPARPVGASPTSGPLPGLSDQDFEGAYRRYLDAHQKLGIEGQAMAKEKLRARLGKQLPKILDQQRCARVRLEIAVEDGKVRLKAWPADRP
ncbi:MAG: hypothetical protein JXP73_22020 [Deltaproteobacteria bacterium]|nr:hypothetical protein [Deltaproteobacteria bacterium]